MYFKEYGQLDWIEPEAYFAGNYKYVGWAVGEDDQPYDILLDNDTQEYFYSNV